MNLEMNTMNGKTEQSGDKYLLEKIKISIKDLHLYYGDFHVLKGINLAIQKNKVTAFIGPSGCGKSTCLKSLNRMNEMVSNCKTIGNILIDGENIYDKEQT